ncbi:MAG: PadR family transcriptional regulator [Ktedonobacteraceae bacterium]|nr:PadR family transcriptional regulator [Ktedonobacteraceae bacterium]
MHKILLLLGMLLHKPLYGYEIHRIVRAHGELYADLKKGNVYYLLDRLAQDHYLNVQVEPGTRGARGERLTYEITDKGREYFNALRREILLSYEPAHSGVDTAVVFLAGLPVAESIELLEERRTIVARRREAVAEELQTLDTGTLLVQIATDHLLHLIDAELTWLDHSLARLQAVGETDTLNENTSHTSDPI